MRTTTISRAREFAEAMLDACEIAEEINGPVQVIFDEEREVAYATRARGTDSSVELVIYPNNMAPTKPDLRIVGI